MNKVTFFVYSKSNTLSMEKIALTLCLAPFISNILVISTKHQTIFSALLGVQSVFI